MKILNQNAHEQALYFTVIPFGVTLPRNSMMERILFALAIKK
jgi:hypothetical protein